MEAEIQLPEDTIQHIQSFLSTKEAAKSSVFSKSFYSAWSTRPILSFDERDFRRKGDGAVLSGGFPNFTRKTIQRYKKLNLKVENFMLCMEVTKSHDDSFYLAHELILDALKLGVIDLKLEIINSDLTSYILPFQVFAATCLRKLYVSGCKIDWFIVRVVICSRLTSLSLSRVFIRDDMIRRILLGCPLIQNFHVSDCKGFKKINVSMMHNNLKKFRVQRLGTLSSLSLSIEFEERRIGSVFDGQINVFTYHNLSSLVLKNLTLDNKFFHNFSHKFPCLEDLTVHCCGGYGDVEISSHSLKCISLTHLGMLNKAQFEVSSIRKFNFSVINNIPSLSFTTDSREWESNISLSNGADVLDVSLFLKLRKFLTELRKSRISLNIKIYVENGIAPMDDIPGFPTPVVENLMLNVLPTSEMCYALLNGLFWSCRPRFIIAPNGIYFKTENYKLIRSICNTLRYHGNQLGKHNLEEVNVELYDEFLMQWQPLPWEEFLLASYILNGGEKVRLRLSWGARTRAYYGLSFFPFPLTIM